MLHHGDIASRNAAADEIALFRQPSAYRLDLGIGALWQANDAGNLRIIKEKRYAPVAALGLRPHDAHVLGKARNLETKRTKQSLAPVARVDVDGD